MTVVVKLGSSIVAADDGSLRSEVLDSICEQVSQLQADRRDIVLVTSGAIARGMWRLGLEARPRGMDELQAASAIGQGDLFHAFEQRLSERGTKAAQVLLTRSDLARRSHYRNARQTLQRLMTWGVVPVINENDTTATVDISFGDNDFLAAQVAVFLHAELLVLLTNTDGLFSGDPRSDGNARLIPEIADPAQLEGVAINRRPSHLGRGGMGSKVAAAEMARQSRVGVVIGNGQSPDTIKKAVAGEPVGTRFIAASKSGKRPSVFKLWLKYATEPTGLIQVDEGAAERLRESGSSLLAVGIRDTAGAFEAGDVVAVVSGNQDEVIGHGVTEYSALDLGRIVGRQSDYVREQFPNGPIEVVHRDRFALS
jgi:glutamate 5-kinase